MTAARALASWALGLEPGDVPGDVRTAAARHLLDGVGCAIAAARMNAAPYGTALASGLPEATVLGSGPAAPVQLAALANGTLVHALDFDDTHAGALVHATAAVLPAAFAVGEGVGATGEEVLTAAIAGYETVIRLGAAVPHGFHARGFHATSVCGVFAAALVAAKLMGLSEDEAVNALGIAGSQAAGSLEFLHTGSSTKQLHPGLAGMNGVVAARLAQAGAEGPASILEGEYGLYRSYLGVEVEPDVLTEGLGARWETTRITIKPYPACQLSHASLDALRAAAVDAPAKVERIVFDVPPASIPIVCEPAAPKARPRSAYEGKFSLPYCAATLLVDRELTVDSFDPVRLACEESLELAGRIGYRARPFDGAPADAPGLVEVRLRDGSVLRGEVPCSRGGPRAPLSNAELLAKFRANGGSDALALALLALGEQASIRAVLRGAR